MKKIEREAEYIASREPDKEARYYFGQIKDILNLIKAKQLPDGRFSDEFQYISYYSLSITIQNQFGFQYSFNTSHVTLYRLSYRNSYQLHLGFNTSHVTLYPSINLV